MAASYPSASKTFPTVVNGQASDAAQVNSVYDEVTAVEQGLLSGLQHLLKPLTTAVYDLGTGVLRWKDLWLSGNVNVAGNVVAAGTVTGGVRFTIDTTSGAGLATGNTNNLAVSATAQIAFISAASGSPVLTGITGGVTGRPLWLVNVGAVAVALGHQTTSTSVNQFVCPAATNLSVRSGGGVGIVHDGSFWRVVTP